MQSHQQSPTIPQLEISNDILFVDEAILVHDKVFGIQDEHLLYNNKDEWLKRIREGGYFIVVTANQVVKGFAVCDITQQNDFKIWLTGVDKDTRGQGIWSKMYKDIVKHAKKKGYKYILINTFPKKFPMMFSFLQKVNAEIYKQENILGFDKVYTKIMI